MAAAQPNPADRDTYAAKFEFALEAKNAGDFDLAKKILQQIYAETNQAWTGWEAEAAPAARHSGIGAYNL